MKQVCPSSKEQEKIGTGKNSRLQHGFENVSGSMTGIA
jgi:hypothetical protein